MDPVVDKTCAFEYVSLVVYCRLKINTLLPPVTEMVTPAHSQMCIDQWLSMPRDTNGVEALNKCSN